MLSPSMCVPPRISAQPVCLPTSVSLPGTHCVVESTPETTALALPRPAPHVAGRGDTVGQAGQHAGRGVRGKDPDRSELFLFVDP